VQESQFFGWLRARPLAFSFVIGVFGLLLIFVGVLGVRSSAADASTLQQLRSGDGISVEGTPDGARTVVRKRAPSLPDKVSYCPRYDYTAVDGVRRTLVDQGDCASDRKQITDQTVRILFDKNDPDVAFIDEPEAERGRSASPVFAWSTLILGVVLVTMGIVRVARARRASNSAQSSDPTIGVS